MAKLKIGGIKITGIAACVPKNKTENSKLSIPNFEMDKFINTTGVETRYIACDETTASDLCLKAAEELILKTGVNREEIGFLVFISQTPDYRLPATSIILQQKLHLNKDTGCFDINLGCSAYPYGIAVLSSLLKNSDKTKALLLVGETVSKQVSNKDKTNAFLFGDAGTATLIELTNDSSNATFFSFSSDGNGFGSLIIPGGGYRHVSSSKTLEEHLDPDGNIRTDEHLFMDGMEIFNFAITRVPKDIKDICAFSGTSLDDIDYFVFHQANKYINNFIAKKLKLLPEKVPFSIKDYGNTSGASIPMTLVDNFDKFDNKCTKCLFSGFGVGLSWSSCIVDLDGVVILPMIKFDK